VTAAIAPWLLSVSAALLVGDAAAPGAPIEGARAPFTVKGVLQELGAAGWPVQAPADPPAQTFIAREDLAYLWRGRQLLSLDVYRPPDALARPAVIILHGGGWESGSRQMERSLAKALAVRGFVAIPVSYRLGTSGRFPAAVRAVKAAVRWARSQARAQGIDPSFVAVVGASAGGHLAALVGASNGVPALDDGPRADGASVVQAVVDIDGAANFHEQPLIAQEERRRGATSRFLGGSFSERPDAWIAASPLTHVSASSAPTLFIATNGVSPILPGRASMAKRLNELGIFSRIDDMPTGTPHPFWLTQPWFTPLVDDISTFLNARQAESPKSPQQLR
jgi:pectinesterase